MILLACPRCARQFDVTSLAPGSKVRCWCNDVLEVGFRSPVAVQALACSRCGGTVSSADEECAFCEAGLSDRSRSETTLCPACYARLPDDSHHCGKCGLELRPQALTPLPEDRSCPRCEGELRIRMLGRADVIECAACEGLWLETRFFEDICREAAERTEPLLDTRSRLDSGTRAGPPATDGYICCIRCGEHLFRRQFQHRDRASGVVLDFCRDHGVWLDGTELRRVLAFLAGAGPPVGSPAAPAPRPAAESVPGPPAEPGEDSSPLGALLRTIGDLFLT